MLALAQHAVVFFLSGFIYALCFDRNPLGGWLLILFPIATIYWLGWWSLLTFFVGLFFGGYIYVQGRIRERDGKR